MYLSGDYQSITAENEDITPHGLVYLSGDYQSITAVTEG